MTFGLDIDDYRTLEALVIRPLQKAGYRVYVFGSRARGQHHKFSDIDLLLEAPVQNSSRVLSLVKEAIEEARFPVKVDFVLARELAESYRNTVDREKVLLQ